MRETLTALGEAHKVSVVHVYHRGFHICVCGISQRFSGNDMLKVSMQTDKDQFVNKLIWLL